MSNKAYLYSSSAPLIYPYWHAAARGGGTNHCIGFVDGCIPLLWLLLFAPEDMRTETLTDDNGRSWTLRAPCVPCADAWARLQARRAFANRLFTDNGGLDWHLDAFAAYLNGLPPQAYLSLDILELQYLEHDFERLPRQLAEVVTQLAAQDAAVKDGLLALSTVMTERRFLPWPEADRAEAEDRWNMYRLLGDAPRPAPWV